MIDVLRAGIFSAVHDVGRVGYRHLGVGQSGAMDSLALRVGNLLVGNPAHAAAIEITVGQPVSLRFNTASRIALTGADCAATLDGERINAWWSTPVSAGQTLTLASPAHGMRACVCVQGGIDVPSLLGSASTDLGAGFGGLAGRILRDGDTLRCGTVPNFPATLPAFGIKPPAWCSFAQVHATPQRPRDYPRSGATPRWLRLIRGPDYAEFTKASQDALWHAEWTITPSSNRMGYRLSGPVLQQNAMIERLSHAVFPGTLQVPPNGQPIALMSDAQTAGGYARIGSIIQADLWQLAQVRLNAPVRFIECSLADARQALLDIEKYLTQVAIAVKRQVRTAPAVTN